MPKVHDVAWKSIVRQLFRLRNIIELPSTRPFLESIGPSEVKFFACPSQVKVLSGVLKPSPEFGPVNFHNLIEVIQCDE